MSRTSRLASHDSPAVDEPAPAESTPLLTPREAAALLSVSEKTLHRLSAPKGTLPCIRLPGKRHVRYRAGTIAQWMRDQEAASLADHVEVTRDG